MLKGLRHVFLVLSLLCFFLLVSQSSLGTEYTWQANASGGGDWTVNSNWSPSTGHPSLTSDIAHFSDTLTGSQPNVLGVSSIAVGDMAFDSTTTAYELTIANTASLVVNGDVSAASATGGAHTIINEGAFDVNAAGAITIGNSSDATLLQITNAGTFTVSGGSVASFYTAITNSTASSDINVAGIGGFWASNTYIPGSTITLGSTSGSSSGTLSIEAVGALGTAPNSPDLRFTDAVGNFLELDADVTYSGAISSYTTTGMGRIDCDADVILSGSVLTPDTLMLNGEIETGRTLTFQGTGEDAWSSATGSTLSIHGEGTIVFDRGGSPTFSAVISNDTPGSGTLEAKQSVILSGENTFTGNLQVDSGANVVFNVAADTTLSGTIEVGQSTGTNAGGTALDLTLASGTVNTIVDGAITVYNGSFLNMTLPAGTTVNGNSTVKPGASMTLLLSGTSAPALTGTFTVDGSGTNPSVVTFDLATDVTASGQFSSNSGDNASLVVIGGNTLTLSNSALTYTGALVLGEAGDATLSVLELGSSAVTTSFGSISGVGQLNIGTNNNVTVVQEVDGSLTPTAITDSGTIVGTGTFSKNGTATLVVDGVGTGSFVTTVEGGTLIVGSSSTYTTASLGSGDVIVNSGATLGGYGSIGATTNEGIVRPGYFSSLTNANNLLNSTMLRASTLLPLTVTSYDQDDSAALEVTINSVGDSSYLNVTGSAALAGTLLIFVDDGFDPTLTYTILTAGGTLSGTFSTVTVYADDGLVSAIPDYSDPQAVFLTVFFDPNKISSAAQTFNQRSLGAYLATVAVPAPVSGLFSSITAAQYPGVADQVSGATYANQQMELARVGNWFTSRLADQFLVRPCERDKGKSRNFIHHHYYCDNTEHLWMVASGGKDRLRAGTASGLNTTTENVVLGFEGDITSNSQLGAAVAFNHFHSDATVQEAANDHGNLFQAGVYFRYGKPRWFFAASLDAGNTDNIKAERYIDTLPGVVQTKGTYMAQIFGEQVRTGYRFGQTLSLQPFVGAVMQQVFWPQILETGNSGFELSMDSNTYKSFRSQLGFELKINTTIQPFVLGIWEHEFSEQAANFDAQFLGSSDVTATFNIVGQASGRDVAVVQAGLRMVHSQRWNMGAFYEGRFSNAWKSNAGSVTVSCTF